MTQITFVGVCEADEEVVVIADAPWYHDANSLYVRVHTMPFRLGMVEAGMVGAVHTRSYYDI